MTVENVVTARGVQKRYGSFLALESVDFEIRRGITGLLGANGAGKTTLLGMVLGLHKADAGSLEVFGIDPWTAGHQVRALIGYAPEHHVLSPHVRAADFVRHVAELHGLRAAEAAVRASDALWLVGLGEERFRPMGTMSTGQRQRVKLAQAIAHDPQLVILDEPTDGLDPIQRENMLQLIKTVSAEYGIDMILSSHLLEEVEMVCDNAVILGEGRTLAWGSLDELQGSAEPSTELELDATGEQVAAIAAALGQSFDVRVASRHLTIRGNSAEVSARVQDACVAQKVGIVRYAEGRRSLEDVYLERSA